MNVAFHGRSRRRRRSYLKSIVGELHHYLPDQVRVTAGKTDVFLYAGTADDARQAERLALEVLARQNAAAAVRLECWDESGETWQQPAPSPWSSAASEQQDAHERRQRQDREQSMTTGLAAWQVRVDLPSHLDVVALAERLKSEGWSVAKRRKHLVAGANCEDDAYGLAQEIEDYGGGDAVIRVERSVFGFSPADSIFPPGPSA